MLELKYMAHLTNLIAKDSLFFKNTKIYFTKTKMIFQRQR